MNKLLKSKILLGVLIVAVLFVGAVVVNKASASDCSLTTTLKQGMRSSEVTCLQTKLGMTTVTGYFGSLTKASVIAFQTNHSLVADGIVGAKTRAALVGTSTEALCPNGMTLASNCSKAPSTTPTATEALCPNGMTLASNCTTAPTGTTTTSGQAGTVEEYKLLSTPANNREVGEGEGDVKVLGMSVEASGSDLSVTAMKLVFDEGTAVSDFEDYADQVKIFYGSQEVASIDADKFTDDNDWTKTISLSSSVIKEGEVGKFYVTVTGADNIDSADLGDTWTIDVQSIRYIDGQGALISEDPGIAARTFSFESLASASDLKLKLTENSSNPEAQVVEVDADNSTEGVLLFKGNLKATGGDLDVKEITADITPTGTGDVSQIASQYTLSIDGTEVQSLDSNDCDTVANNCDGAGVSGTAVAFTFDDVDVTVEEGDTVTVEIFADINDTSATFVNGDSLAVTIDADDMDVEDENGDSVGASVTDGVVVGEKQTFYSEGIQVSVTGTPTAVVSHVGDPSNALDSDQGTFTISFNVTAFGTDVYVDKTAPLEEAAGTTGTALTITGTNGSTASTITAQKNLTGTNGYKVVEGTTEKFTVTTNITAGASGFFDVSINDILYAVTDVTGNIHYTSDLGDLKTPQIFLNYDAA